MEAHTKENKVSGSGGFGAPRPGVAGMTEQVLTISSSDNCKETVYGVDPRPCTRSATGMSTKNTNINMDGTNKREKTTGSGEVGCPRPGEEGISRVPSPSLSGNRRKGQVIDQACTSGNATGIGNKPMGSKEMSMYVSEESSEEEFQPPSRRASGKRKKRTFSTTTLSGSEAAMGSENEKRKADKKTKPLPAKSSKRLPTQEERLAELRHAPSASLAINIMEAADEIEQMASTANNLSGPYVRRLRDNAGKARANATELAKRTKVAGAQIALEQENLQLRAKLEQATEEIAELKRERTQGQRMEAEEENQSETPVERQPTKQKEIRSMPPKQAGPAPQTRTKPQQQQEPTEGKVHYSAIPEIQALAEQVNALKELVMQRIVGEKLPSRNVVKRQEAPSKDIEGSRAKGNKRKEKEPVLEENTIGRKSVDTNAQKTTPHTTPGNNETWAKVLGRKEKDALKNKEKKEAQQKTARQGKQGNKGQNQSRPRDGNRNSSIAVKPPRRAAITLGPRKHKDLRGTSRNCQREDPTL